MLYRKCKILFDEKFILIVKQKIFKQEEIAKKFGVYLEHLYLITDSIEYDKKTLLKVHNPFNTKDDIKKLKKLILILQFMALNFFKFCILVLKNTKIVKI